MFATLLLAILGASSTLAFAPAAQVKLTPPSLLSHWRLHAATEESAAASPFDTYELGQSTLAYKDDIMGEGDAVAGGDVVTVSFVGRLYPSGYQFAKNEDFVFEVGEGKTMPGFDKALVGTQVGCKRILRVPPSLAFGARGNAVSRCALTLSRRTRFSSYFLLNTLQPKIPPNADLEFDIEVKAIARGAVAGTIAKIGIGRLLGFIACFAVLAITPLLS